jgi:hypothetical protein
MPAGTARVAPTQVESPPVTRLTAPERAYFAAVAVLAAWVGVWGYFAPASVERALPWPVPPLHARFLGAMYLAGVVFTVGCMLARHWRSVRVVVPMIAVWTGMLFVVSLFHLDDFDFDRAQSWVWFAAYLVYPLIAAALAVAHRGERPGGDGRPPPAWAHAVFAAIGAAATAVGLALLVAPGTMADVWPWPITELLAQIYSAPFLSVGAGTLILARERTWLPARIPVAALLVFAAAVLVASIIHRALFDAAEPSAWLWFGGFAAAACALAALAAAEVRSRAGTHLPN